MDARVDRESRSQRDWRIVVGVVSVMVCIVSVAAAIATFEAGWLHEDGFLPVIWVGCAAAVAAMLLLLSAAGVRFVGFITGVTMLVAGFLLVGALFWPVGNTQSSMVTITLWYAGLVTGTSAVVVLAASTLIALGRFAGRHLGHGGPGRSARVTP